MLKLTEKRVGNSLENIETGKKFLNIIPMAQSLRLTIDKWDLMKLESFCKAKALSIGQNGNLQIEI